MNRRTCIDPDGNVLKRGMVVLYMGEKWVIGDAGRYGVRLDLRQEPFVTHSAFVATVFLRAIHLLHDGGTAFIDQGNDPYPGGQRDAMLHSPEGYLQRMVRP